MSPVDIKLVSLVIPVYNEQECLPELIRRIQQACQELSCRYEVLLVDDGSMDQSQQIIRAAVNEPDSHFVGVFLNRNYGQHAALMAGFEQSRGDLVITLDADLQNPPEEIPRLVSVASQGYEVVGTRRQSRQDSWLRKLPSRIVNMVAKKITRVNMSDYGSMLRAYRRHIVDAMLSCHERSTFIPILANSFARDTIEIPISHTKREMGESKYSFLKLVNYWFDMVTCMTTGPLRLLSILGTLIAVLGFAGAVFLLILRFLFGAIWAADGVFTLFAILFMFIGAQFIGMGLLGEYIGRIYHDVRARPRYFVQQVVRGHATSELQENQP